MGIFLIGSAALQAGVCTNTVRNYERQGFISPVRDSAGRRLFTIVDIEKIRQIHAANQAQDARRRGSRVERAQQPLQRGR